MAIHAGEVPVSYSVGEKYRSCILVTLFDTAPSAESNVLFTVLYTKLMRYRIRGCDFLVLHLLYPVYSDRCIVDLHLAVGNCLAWVGDMK